MADPSELSFDEVIRFLIERGGRSTNRELVSYFRPLLNDPVNQVTNRLRFRDIVNNIANVKEEQGEKYVCLKEKYAASYMEDNRNEFDYANSSIEDYHSNYMDMPRSTSEPQNYQPYWRYRLSSNTKLVPPPPLLSFRFSDQEETTSLPTHLPNSSARLLINGGSFDDSFEIHPNRFSSPSHNASSETKNYYSPIHREDPAQLDSSWIHEQGPRYQRYYSEPKDVDWSAHLNGNLYNNERLRHNSIAVGIAAGSLLETPENDEEDHTSSRTLHRDRRAISCNTPEQSPVEDEYQSINSKLSQSGCLTVLKSDDLNIQQLSKHETLSESQKNENKENIEELNKSQEVQKEKVEEIEEENVLTEYRPHSESVKERARRIDSMANEMTSTTKASISTSTPSKLKTMRSEKVSDDNLSVASQLDTKLRRQWFVKSAQSDYLGMVTLLKKEPRLAGIRDITSGFTALHWAAKHGNAEVVKLIAGTHRVNPDVKSHGGYTCLHIATLYKHKSIVDLLIRTYGANPTIRDNSGKRADQYPPDYVSYTAGVNRRPADPRTSKANIVICLNRRKWSSLKGSPNNHKQAPGKYISNIRRALRPNRSGSESDISARIDISRRMISAADTL